MMKVTSASLFSVIAGLCLIGCPGGGDDPGLPPDGTTAGESDVPDVVTPETSDPKPDAGPRAQIAFENAPSYSEPFPAAQVGVRITDPSGARGHLLCTGTAVLGGVAFGEIESMSWKKGDLSGQITPSFYWQTSGIALDKGDNPITITAVGKDGSVATDTIVVTSHSCPLAGLRLRVSPDHIFAGEPRRLTFTLSLPLGTVEAGDVKLYGTGEDGANLSPLDVSDLRDDGLSTGSRCDPVAGDLVYTGCRVADQAPPGRLCYRARVPIGLDTVATPTVCVDVLSRFDSAACFQIGKVLEAGRTAYASASAHEAGVELARTAALATASTVPVADSGLAAGGWGIWLRFSNGVLAALPLGIPDGFRGTPVGSHRAILFRAAAGGSEILQGAGKLTDKTCPPWDTRGPHEKQDATLSRFRELAGNGVIAFSAHGGAFFDGQTAGFGWRHSGYQEVIWTGEAVHCEELSSHAVACEKDSECPPGGLCRPVGADGEGECVEQTHADLLRGRVAVGPESYGITPAFVDHYTGGLLPGSLVYAGSCHSLFNGSLAMAFLGAGAASYVGFNDIVRNGFAEHVGQLLLAGLVDDHKTIGEAMPYGWDPEHPDTHATMAGATALDLSSPGLFNAGFELPDMQGWAKDGDGRRVTSFCGETATEGKFMGLISTGLGFTTLNGAISQKLCIPAGTKTLRFSWKYFSAELPLSCATQFQDRWKVTLTKVDGSPAFSVLDCAVDDMCWYQEEGCTPEGCLPSKGDCDCGKCYEHFAPPGMEEKEGAYSEATCTFGEQPVQATGWVTEELDVSALAGGGPVTLTFSVKDVGQSTNDTAVLLDDVELK